MKNCVSRLKSLRLKLLVVCNDAKQGKTVGRFLRDALPRRLGGLAATLGRVSSVARKSSDPENVTRLLEEVKYLIEWTAADAEPEVAGELVSMQILVNLWLKSWEKTNQNKEHALCFLFKPNIGLTVHWNFRDWYRSFKGAVWRVALCSVLRKALP